MSASRQSIDKGRTSALPKAWIVPIRLGIYSMLAACSAYIYFNLGELEFTHYLVIVCVVAVLAMALLDCRMSEEFWRKQEAQEKSGNSR